MCLSSSVKMGYFYRAIVQLSQADITMLFSQSPGQPAVCMVLCHCKLVYLEETAVLINKVTSSEHSSGFGINVPVEMDSMKQKVFTLSSLCAYRIAYVYI